MSSRLKAMGRPGKTGPAIFAFTSPRPSLRSSTKLMGGKTTPSDPQTRGCCLSADHFGASPVASALGIRSGATPRGPIHTNTTPSIFPSKQDISTLHGLGHFYFALTADMSAT